ncbi:unnamed protein product [Mytilus edulis]|uniref:Uncharacterized protein n=1 Tax=Mytilus edulis TaxID=6550 RepID=A0A8S3TAV8_MYTED|nr:unnamed protein product [Mytilus edulis]
MADDAFLHKIDEPSTLAGIKHLTPNTSKELQDIVVEKAGRLPEVTRFCTSLSKIYIGNLWARCDFSVWTAVKYSESFQMMEKLVKDLSLSFDKEVQLAEEIQILKIDGHYLLFGPEMIEVVRHCMVRLDASLEQLPKETDDDYLRIKNEGILETLFK